LNFLKALLSSAGITVGGPLTGATTGTFSGAITSGTANAYVAPVYTAAGAATAASEHEVRGQAAIAVANGSAANAQFTSTISLTAPAAFSSASYQVLVAWFYASGYPGAIGNIVGLSSQSKAAGSFQIAFNIASACNAAGTVYIDWVAKGT
jgi:hypothetical protein